MHTDQKNNESLHSDRSEFRSGPSVDENVPKIKRIWEKCKRKVRGRKMERATTLQMVRENIKSNYQFSSHSHLSNKITGRLLAIVAKQAIQMKNPTQKIFLDALVSLKSSYKTVEQSKS